MMSLFDNPFPKNAVAFTSDRTVDFTLANDQRILNKTQKEFLSSRLNSDLPEPVHIRQVHGDKIIIAEKSSSNEHDLEEADGLITQSFNLPLAIRSADCLPVFLCDDNTNSIGLIHVGWKGDQKNILEQTIRLMNSEWNVSPEKLKVVFGPSIHSCCYEVGGEFRDFFPGGITIRDSRYYFDLPQTARRQLLACGVKDVNIFKCDVCTFCESSCFSFRREGERAGRMISLMMLKK